VTRDRGQAGSAESAGHRFGPSPRSVSSYTQRVACGVANWKTARVSPRGLHGSAMIVSVGVPRGCWAKALLVVTATSAAVVLLAGCTDDALPQGTTSSPAPAAAERSASQPPGPSLMTCGSTSPETRPPEWAVTDAGVPGDIPTAVSKNGLVSATIFANPLHAPARPSGAANKILWVVKLPREGLPLTITATPLDHNGPAVTIIEPADSGPGEIYPSVVDVPTPGCWQLNLQWAGNHDIIELLYQPTN